MNDIRISVSTNEEVYLCIGETEYEGESLDKILSGKLHVVLPDGSVFGRFGMKEIPA